MSFKSVMRRLESLIFRHGPLMMTCRDCDRFLDEYLDGSLPRRQTFVFETHLRLCPPCRDYLDSYRAAIEAGKKAYDDTPPEIPEEMIRAILEARKAEPEE